MEINTLGDHIRAARIERGLEIKAVAAELQVTPDSVINWEQGRHSPTVTHGARILAFLDYVPFEDPATIAEVLKRWRWQRGLSADAAAGSVGIDPCTWRSWESKSSRRIPTHKIAKRLEQHGIHLPTEMLKAARQERRKRHPAST